MIYNDINPRPKYYIIIEYDNDNRENINLIRERALININIKTMEEIKSLEELDEVAKYLIQREKAILEAGDNIHAYYSIIAYMDGIGVRYWYRERRANNES